MFTSDFNNRNCDLSSVEAAFECNRFNHCDFKEKISFTFWRFINSLQTSISLYVYLYLTSLYVRHVPEKLSPRLEAPWVNISWTYIKNRSLIPQRGKNSFVVRYIIKSQGGLGKTPVPITTSWEASLKSACGSSGQLLVLCHPVALFPSWSGDTEFGELPSCNAWRPMYTQSHYWARTAGPLSRGFSMLSFDGQHVSRL